MTETATETLISLPPPGLNLDKRQRAMLREMGIRVWSPLSAPVVPVETVADTPAAAAQDKPNAPDSIATNTHGLSTTAHFDSKNSPEPAPAATARPPARPAVAPAAPVAQNAAAAPSPTATGSHPAHGLAHWQMGQPQALYADGSTKQGNARWLVLAESPAAALQPDAAFKPFEGDAGKLLDNMLRAARLHQQAAQVWLAPLVRQLGGPAESPAAAADLNTTLAELVSKSQPDVVLVMGRLAAQALLQSDLPLGKLRGQVHRLHGAAAIVTLDAAYLLRTPLDKAKAWDDLCLAMSLVNKAG